MKPSQREKLFNEFGKYCLDLSKLVFGGVILAGIMQLNINQLWLFILGDIGSLLLMIAGLTCFCFAKDKNRKLKTDTEL